jgi:hypothetical protein
MVVVVWAPLLLRSPPYSIAAERNLISCLLFAPTMAGV